MEATTRIQLVHAESAMDVSAVEPTELRKFTPAWAYIPLVEEEDAAIV